MNKSVINNFFFLLILQGTNYLLPLITFPYLARVLGINNFGLLAFALAMVGYFIVLTDYGFNLTATKEISVHRDNKQKLVEIFSSVMLIKMFFLIIGFLIYFIIVFSFDKFKQNFLIYILTYGIVIGKALFPQWFFQGIEKMKYITILNVMEKSVFTLLIFVFVKFPDDVYKVPLINSLGTVLIGFFSIFIIQKQFGIKIKKQTIKTLIFYLKDGWHIFISNIAISLYTLSTTFFLGLFTNNTIVGYFAAADKIRAAIQNLFLNPFSQALYPFIAKKVTISKLEAIIFIRRILIFSFFVFFIISLFLLFFAKYIVLLLLGEAYERSVILLQILSFLPLMIGLSNIFGIQTMITFGMKKIFSKILILGSILNFILLLFFIPLFKDIGAAISMLVVESFITVSMFFYLKKSGIDLIKGKINV